MSAASDDVPNASPAGVPNVYASVSRFEGQATVFGAPGGPCYRCLFREPPPAGLMPSCAEAGVLGVLPGLLGTIQAGEALKLLFGVGEPLVGRLLRVDALTMRTHLATVRADPACPACGTRETTALAGHDAWCGASPRPDEPVTEIAPRELAALLAALLAADAPVQLLDVREPAEWATDHTDGARLVPLGTLADAVPSLDPSRAIVVHCHSGARSADAVRRLRAAGFASVRNLAGGIVPWRREVEHSPC